MLHQCFAEIFNHFGIHFVHPGKKSHPYGGGGMVISLTEIHDLFQCGPPFTLDSPCHGFLHRVRQKPPVAGHLIAHLPHVGNEILPFIDHVAEEDSISQENGIIADMGFADPVEHTRKGVTMKCFIPFGVFGLQPDDASKNLVMFTHG